LDAVPNNATDDSRTSALWNRNNMLDSEQLYFLRFPIATSKSLVVAFGIKMANAAVDDDSDENTFSVKSVHKTQMFNIEVHKTHKTELC